MFIVEVIQSFQDIWVAISIFLIRTLRTAGTNLEKSEELKNRRLKWNDEGGR